MTELADSPAVRLCALQSVRAVVIAGKLVDPAARGPGYYSFSCQTGVKQVSRVGVGVRVYVTLLGVVFGSGTDTI